MFSINQFEIKKISVIGAGHIGPDIILHLARHLSSYNINLLLEDVSETALSAAKERIHQRILKTQMREDLDVETCRQIGDSIQYSTNLRDIQDTDILIEATPENRIIKNSIFKQIETFCRNDCIFLSNTSHIIPEIIFDGLNYPERCLVAHYFYPADRNCMMELIPLKQTDPTIISQVNSLFSFLGKQTMTVKSSFGFAVDPIFEGICKIALDSLDKGVGSVKQIDQIAKEALGLKIGPFALLNLCGGNPILDHGLDGMNQHLMPWFRSPENLGQAILDHKHWPTAKKGEIVDVTVESREKLIHRFQGAYFALASFIADLRICDLNELNNACHKALEINPPFTFMNELGSSDALYLTEKFCAEETGFKVPKSLIAAAQEGGWELK